MPRLHLRGKATVWRCEQLPRASSRHRLPPEGSPGYWPSSHQAKWSPWPCPATGAGAFISTQPSVLVSLSVNELYVDDPDKDSGGKIDVSLNISLPNLHCECEYPQQPPAPAGRTGQTANTRDRRLSPLLWRGECDRMHMHLAAFWNKKHKKPPTGVTSGGRPCRGGGGCLLGQAPEKQSLKSLQAIYRGRTGPQEEPVST